MCERMKCKVQCLFLWQKGRNHGYTLGWPWFVDTISAFDRVSLGKLFERLISRGVPFHFVAVMKKWYNLQRMFPIQGIAISSSFGMSKGIRPGLPQSPHLANIHFWMSFEIGFQARSWAGLLAHHLVT